MAVGGAGNQGDRRAGDRAQDDRHGYQADNRKRSEQSKPDYEVLKDRPVQDRGQCAGPGQNSIDTR